MTCVVKVVELDYWNLSDSVDIHQLIPKQMYVDSVLSDVVSLRLNDSYKAVFLTL
jgi:hypothetical protein